MVLRASEISCNPLLNRFKASCSWASLASLLSGIITPLTVAGCSKVKKIKIIKNYEKTVSQCNENQMDCSRY